MKTLFHRGQDFLTARKGDQCPCRRLAHIRSIRLEAVRSLDSQWMSRHLLHYTLLFGRAERVAALRGSFYRVQAMSNIVSGRQIRAARMLAGLTQADLARAAGCHPRSVRYWENKGSNPPTSVASTLDSIEQALNRHGVIPFSTPTPGVRCSS